MRANQHLTRAAAAIIAVITVPGAALAAEEDKTPASLSIEPIVDARVRLESVEQGELDADALTLRVRAGAQARLGALAILAEGEATAAAVDNYNAFQFAIMDSQRRSRFAVVADPQSIELNRLQLQYRSSEFTVTAGRQRINLDDQRWVGSAGWRQNEQTFDALRGEADIGPFNLDLAYAISQRTIFGSDAGPRTAIDGHFLFAGVGTMPGPVSGKLFAYLVDYDEAFARPNSSQTYGGFLSATVPVGRTTKLDLRASYARQSDHGRNPVNYSASYWSLEGGARMAGFRVSAGWEKLGADGNGSVQTPLATLHKFNGWADVFLTTPPDGLEDAYFSVSKTFDKVKRLPGLQTTIAFHQFDSARNNREYGTEWDASAGFRLGKFGILLKYADYDARSFGADTQKLWLQAEYAFGPTP